MGYKSVLLLFSSFSSLITVISIFSLRNSFRYTEVSNSTAMDLNLDAPHSMGTTIIGVTYNGGVVLGADSRTSTGEIPLLYFSRVFFFFCSLGLSLSFVFVSIGTENKRIRLFYLGNFLRKLMKNWDLLLLLATGMYVANRASDKITQLTDNVYVCRSGSVISRFFGNVYLGISFLFCLTHFCGKLFCSLHFLTCNWVLLETVFACYISYSDVCCS